MSAVYVLIWQEEHFFYCVSCRDDQQTRAHDDGERSPVTKSTHVLRSPRYKTKEVTGILQQSSARFTRKQDAVESVSVPGRGRGAGGCFLRILAAFRAVKKTPRTRLLLPGIRRTKLLAGQQYAVFCSSIRRRYSNRLV